MKNATAYLFNQVIPQFAKELLEAFRKLKTPDDCKEFPLIEMLHSKGINIRHLGIVALQVLKLKDESSSKCVSLIRLEIIARVIKLIYRRKLRETMQVLRVPLQQPYVIAICKQFNLVFGNSKKSVSHSLFFPKKY